jgi:hypothetical protein
MHELSLSQPALLQRTTRTVPDMLPKAYRCASLFFLSLARSHSVRRFVGEMEEIRDFVDDGVPGGTAEIWEGLARLFERVADSVREQGEDVKVLDGFVEDAKAALQREK